MNSPVDRAHRVRRINLVSIVIDAALAISKIIAGIFGHSHALVMDGLHSFSDLITDFLVHGFHKISARKPDKEHPYGHGRFETLGTLVFSVILLGVAAGLVWETVTTASSDRTPESYTLFVAIVALIAKELLFRFTLKWGQQLSAPLLIANAWHHRSDVLSTVAVVCGLLGARFGYPSADIWAAVIVGVLIAWMAGKLIWASVAELVDTSLYRKHDHFRREICSVPGVRSIHALRSRKMGPHTFVDVHIEVPATISVSDGHRIADDVVQQLKQKFPDIADVTVHVDAEPDDKEQPSSKLPNRAEVVKWLAKYWQRLPEFEQILGLQIHYLGGKVHCDVILPLALVTQANQNPDLLAQSFRDRVQAIDWVGDINFLFASQAVQLYDALTFTKPSETEKHRTDAC